MARRSKNRQEKVDHRPTICGVPIIRARTRIAPELVVEKYGLRSALRVTLVWRGFGLYHAYGSLERACGEVEAWLRELCMAAATPWARKAWWPTPRRRKSRRR